MKVVAVVLTLNESKHLRRCLESISGFVDEVVVVDCYSTDDTINVASRMGATILEREWINYASQFNWAIRQLASDTDWVLRIDADEYVTQDFKDGIRDFLSTLDIKIDGVVVNRRMKYMGRLIRFGGVFPIKVLRLFRPGRGKCENRWMDEHIKVPGQTIEFCGEIIDDNLNSLSWWIDKHNSYASREAVDLLNLEFQFMPKDSIAALDIKSQAGVKRWVKERVYSVLPGGLRAFAYFTYRYFLRLGFLDGRRGTAFHVLQGFWYRYLVDEKVAEVKRHMEREHEPVEVAIDRVLDVKL